MTPAPPPPVGAPPMAVPAPPPKPGAPKDLLDSWETLSQKIRLEDAARTALGASMARNASYATIIADQKALAFAMNITSMALELYQMDYETAYPDDVKLSA